ncbi:MAG: hypothetical protein JJ969_12795 [Rhizobiaceae bacterium]|nr:hypothetical protein [Rhizobiaceae bacterium]
MKRLADDISASSFFTDDNSLEVFDTNGDVISDGEYEQLDQLHGRLSDKLDDPIHPGHASNENSDPRRCCPKVLDNRRHLRQLQNMTRSC